MVRPDRDEHARAATPGNGRTANRRLHQTSLKGAEMSKRCVVAWSICINRCLTSFGWRKLGREAARAKGRFFSLLRRRWLLLAPTARPATRLRRLPHRTVSIVWRVRSIAPTHPIPEPASVGTGAGGYYSGRAAPPWFRAPPAVVPGARPC